MGTRRIESTARWIGTVLLLAALAACAETSTDPEVQPDAPARVRITPDAIRLLVGNHAILSVEVLTSGGTILPLPDLRWTSSDSAVARVEAPGTVVAVGRGRATIVATAGKTADSVIVDVPEPAGRVSASGGQVVAFDGAVSLRVPADALAAEVAISVVRADSAYEFGPSGLTFAKPAALSIRYDRTRTNPLEARRLRLHRLSGSAWIPVAGSSVDTANATVSGDISSFSTYGVAAVANRGPDITIKAPKDSTTVDFGAPVTFAADVFDTEDDVIPVKNEQWVSSLDGPLGTGSSITRSDLSIGKHVVTLTATDSEGASTSAKLFVTVVDGPPIVEILQPADGATFSVSRAVVLTGTAKDFVDGKLPDASLVWKSSLDGSIGTGPSITVSTLSVGKHSISLTATDSHGNAAHASASIEIREDESPVVKLTSPANGSVIGDRTAVTMSGSAFDPEDGQLSGASLVWKSSRDGLLGTGTSVTRTLSIGSHVVTLTATDSHGNSASASVGVTIFDEPPPLLTPVLVYAGVQAGVHKVSVANWADYDLELFVLDSTLPPCGLNTNAGRTWVDIFGGDGVRRYGYCALDDRAGLTSLAALPGSTLPATVYIELWDRATDRRVRSNSVVIPERTLSASVQSTDTVSGRVTINGADTRQPSTPFTFTWGDGQTTSGFFPQTHTYADKSKNYPARVRAYYPGGVEDEVPVLVRFVP